MDIFEEAEMELGINPGELSGTFSTRFVDDVLNNAEVTVNFGDLWKVLEGDNYDGIPPKPIWDARMRLYKAINKVRNEIHGQRNR